MFIVAQMWEDPKNDVFLDELSHILSSANACKRTIRMDYITSDMNYWPLHVSPNVAVGDAPIHSLRSVYMHLRKNGTLRQIHSRVLDILRLYDDDDSSDVIVPPSSTGLTSGMRLQFRKSLTSHLFGWDKLLVLRMKLAVADFCWVGLS
jgi:general transcription factor 3C polypeptide 4